MVRPWIAGFVAGAILLAFAGFSAYAWFFFRFVVNGG